MPQLYNAPPGTPSDIGSQMNTYYWDRRSLIDAAEQMFFSPLADARSMPMHYGKELKVYYYVPLLDDRNVNDQGLDAAGVVMADGNMYGSSKDVGTITARMPTLTEEGGRVNRVGFTRLERSGTLQEHGFFTEFSEDSLMFDTDSDLYGHMSREMVAGANEVTEDLLQVDLLTNAGIVVYGGTATQDSEVTGEGVESLVTWTDLKRLSIALDDNRTPKNTKVIKGSNLTDTMTVNAARIMYIGSELQMTVEAMVDGLGNPAFVPVRKYAAASTLLNGEIGSVGDFRVIVVPNMMKWEGAGAAETGANEGYSATGGNYDIFPMLVVGDGSFATVGLQGGGTKAKGKQKFKIIVKKPGKEMATVQDPYGKIGFSSITFYHGFIALRPERLAVVKTVAAE